MPTESVPMAPATTSTSEPQADPARRLRGRYVLSLAVIGAMSLSGTLSIHYLFDALERGPPAVNAAGRQRMLSLRLTRDAIGVSRSSSPEIRQVYLAYLGKTLAAWTIAHERLRREMDDAGGFFSNDILQTAMLHVERRHKALHEAGLALLAAYSPSAGGQQDPVAAEQAVERIVEEEHIYLIEMAALISLYEATALSRVRLIHGVAIALGLASVLVLVVTGLFVLEPSVRLISRQFRRVSGLASANRNAERRSELRNEFIEKVFGRYVSDEVVHRLLDTSKGLALGGEECEVTLLMADLRGFTALSANLPPQKTAFT